jgi:NaMN:DMB phosphoribosyltransferase
VTLAGGTQMTAVCAFLKEAITDFSFDNVSIATTIFVARDEIRIFTTLANKLHQLTYLLLTRDLKNQKIQGLKIMSKV